MSDTSSPIRILVTDDDALARTAMRHALEVRGYEVVEANHGQSALAKMDEHVDAVLLDLDMPIMSGIECLRAVQHEFPGTPVLIVSGQDQVEVAVEAMKAGADDYITKPLKLDELPNVVEQLLENSRSLTDTADLAKGRELESKSDLCLGADISARLIRLAELDSTILLTGESGTGKSTLAKLIHRHSRRATGPFITVNCASLPRELIESELFGHTKGSFTGALTDRIGRVESANGGTIFMDEIGDLPLELQPKLLTFLQDRIIQRIGCNQERTVDVRVIAATHQDLLRLCDDKQFREDLYYRLNVLNLHVAPLRRRQDDLETLIHAILAKISTKRDSGIYELADGVLEKLQDYRWPGNIRELENTLERATAYCSDRIVTEDHIEFSAQAHRYRDASPPLIPKKNQAQTLAKIERDALIEALGRNGGNRAKTARDLGISEKGLYNKLKRYELYSPSTS